MKCSLLIFNRICLILLCIQSVLSYGLKVYKITLKGTQIIGRDLIQSHLQVKVNTTYRSLKIKNDVQKLASLGFFDSVEAHTYTSQKGIHVVYRVKERAFVNELEFQGYDHVSLEDLKELSKIQVFDFLNFNELYQTFSAIKKKYKEKGYFFVQVSHKLVPIPKSQKFKLIIKIQEKQKIQIKKINFIGNLNISSEHLKSRMLTKEQSILSAFGISGVYNPEHLNRDLALIEYLYRDRGYINVRLEKPEISLSPSQKSIYISITILEGARFKLGDIRFQDDQIVSSKDVVPYLDSKIGDYFSLSRFQKDLNFVKSLYTDRGYAFANVQTKTYFDSSGENKVHIFLNVKKGEMYKVRTVLIKGNHSTRDKVILRRLFVREGLLYRESKNDLTKQLLQQLGFFEEVNLYPVLTDEKGLLDLHVDLKERETTGEARLAGGYNGYSGLFINGGITKNNFLGLDQSLSFNVNLNRYEELFNVNYMNPYLLDSDWSFGLDIFNIGQDVYDQQRSSVLSGGIGTQRGYSYSQSNLGFSVSFGRHLNTSLTTFLKYRLKKQSLSNNSFQILSKIPVVGSIFNFIFGERSAQEDFREVEGFAFDDIYPLEEGEGVNSSVSGILEYKKLNDYYYPTKGLYGRLSLEYAGLGGDFKYTKIEARTRHYKPLFWKLILKNTFQFGWVFPNFKNQVVPFTELFLLGGPYNLRGYQVNQVGPRRFSQKAYEYAQKQNLNYPRQFAERVYGGKQMIYYSLGLEFPLLKGPGVRAACFFDIGEANDRLTFDINDQLRLNVGLGIRWRSPFGPLNIDIAYPYKPRTEYGENSVELQFGINPPF